MLMRRPPKERKRVLNTRKLLIVVFSYIFLLSGSSWYLKIFPWQTYSNWSMREQYFSFSGCSWDWLSNLIMSKVSDPS